MMSIRSFVAAGAVAMAIALTTHAGVPAPALNPDAPLPGFAGSGLGGSIWLGGNQGTILDNRAYTLANSPSGGFLAAVPDYPGSDSVVNVFDTVNRFLDQDAPSLTGFDGSAVSTSNMLVVLSGFVAIPASGLYRFGVASDDGFELLVGGSQLAAYNGDRGYGMSYGSAEFSGPGLYAIDLLYWANSVGQSGLTLVWDQGVGSDQVVPTSRLYIPSPAAGALAALAGLCAARRRR